MLTAYLMFSCSDICTIKMTCKPDQKHWLSSLYLCFIFQLFSPLKSFVLSCCKCTSVLSLNASLCFSGACKINISRKLKWRVQFLLCKSRVTVEKRPNRDMNLGKIQSQSSPYLRRKKALHCMFKQLNAALYAGEGPTARRRDCTHCWHCVNMCTTFVGMTMGKDPSHRLSSFNQ